MEKEFIPYEEAKALKELGFSELCLKGFYNQVELYSNIYSPIDFNNKKQLGEFISCPLYQQAFRWFRDNYDLDGFIQKCGQGYSYQIYKKFNTKENESIPQKGWCVNYELTELVCLRKLIEIVKN